MTRKLTVQQDMYKAIMEVCVLDESLVPRGRFGKFASDLIKGGYTPEQIRNIYGPGGWWYANDWRGKKGDPPNEHAIRTTAAQHGAKIKTAIEEGGGVHL